MEFSRLTRLVKLDLSCYYDYFFINPLGTQTIQIQNPNLFTLFRNLSGLTELYLDGVNISANGYEWGQAISSALPNLRVLSLGGCFLSGPIDSSLQNLQFLSEINLDGNDLSVPVPDFFANFENLTTLSLSDCNLNGTFPEIIFERVQTLETLDLSYNELLNGRLPDFPQNLSLRNLVLSYTNFSGFLPESIGKLTELRRIEIRWCNFNGRIPNSLANLSQLVYLDLSYNNFSGPIPSFQGLKKLTHIDLSRNALTVHSQCLEGQKSLLLQLKNSLQFDPEYSVKLIPMEFSRLTRLVKLDLSTSYSPETQRLKILNPNLFTLFHNLSGLTELYLDGVNISANGYDWGQAISSALPNLTVLSLRDCNLNGTFPDTIFERVQTLETFDLSDNTFLHGRLPESIGKLTELRRIEIRWCNFNGPIPNSLANLSQLVQLDLSGNNFSGPIPNSLANLSQLVYLDLSVNNFSGPIPSFQGSKKLTHIYLYSNSLTGVVLSTHFEGLLDLVHIDLSSNSFNGSIPSSLFSLPSLQEILLYNNKFSGPITGFSNESLSPLVSLDLSSNKLEGPIPAHFFHFLGLNSLSLSFNNFSGNIDLEIFQRFQNLTTLELSYNNLTVNPSVTNSSLSSFPQLWTLRLPSCKLQKFPPLMNQSRLSDLDLSNNQISGVIPNWIWNISQRGFSYLNLSCNLLVGFQPKFRIPLLNSIDLHSNQLQGEIPLPPESAAYLDYSRNNFSSIPAEIGKSIASTFFFSLSDNMLSGPIPPSICNVSSLMFLDLSNNRFSGTIPQRLIDTCSAILIVLDLRNNNLTEPRRPTFDSRQEDEINWVYITATLGYIVGFGVIVGPLLYSKRWRQCYYKPVDRVILRILHHRERRARHQRRRDNKNQLRRRQHH
ncbi:hypothetical protein Vadar_013469 [Vaccinium darrowii]|uniref:Uncharacterized protein n=1 Tax=Vaccinium darrowii TaxID=229202 RepID=A0ACB7ZK17_9ERIC|nr:hypothetical protein Vadar_013469 [Vaccinium darrowii]